MNATKRLASLMLAVSLAASPGSPAYAGRHRGNLDHVNGLGPAQIVPLKIYRNFLVVAEGQIGGVPETENFILDTGSSPSILNASVATRLGLRSTPSQTTALGTIVPVQAAALPELVLGPLRVRGLPILVKDLSQLERDSGVPIAGILGLDVLSKASFRLDYDAGELQFGEISHDGIPVHFDARAGIAVADVKIGDKAVRLLVDTGSEILVLLGGNFADGGLPHLRNTSQRGTTVADSGMNLRIFSAPDITIGAAHFQQEKAYLVPGSSDPEFDGMMGVRSFGFRALSFDRLSGTIFLEK
jgi:hypothetical protein